MSIKDILMTGFCGTSSELLVNKADCKSLILPNDKILDSQILLAELERQSYEYIFSFGQKPNIRDKVYLETTARNGNKYVRQIAGYSQGGKDSGSDFRSRRNFFL